MTSEDYEDTSSRGQGQGRGYRGRGYRGQDSGRLVPSGIWGPGSTIGAL